MIGRFLWDPAHELDRLQEEVNRLFARVGDRQNVAAATLRPAMRAQEADEGYWLTFDVPGVRADAMSLEVQDNVVQLQAERRGQGYQARYERTVQLPEAADAENIRAELADGVLSVFVPKRAQTRARRIEIGGAIETQQTAEIDAGAAVESGAEQREPAGAAV